jgi:hypothetical protein
VARMKADAAASDERLQRLARAGTESWSALSAALAETRGVFDRANQAAREAFERAQRRRSGASRALLGVSLGAVPINQGRRKHVVFATGYEIPR